MQYTIKNLAVKCFVRYKELAKGKDRDSEPASKWGRPLSLTVGKRIANLRQIKGLSLPDLAKKAGISKGYLWQIENGAEPNPSIGLLTKIAEALDTTVADLLGQPKVRVKHSAIPDKLPSGLKELVQEQKRKGTPVPEDIVRALAHLQARGARVTSKEDWEYLYETIRRVMRREERT